MKLVGVVYFLILLLARSNIASSINSNIKHGVTDKTVITKNNQENLINISDNLVRGTEIENYKDQKEKKNGYQNITNYTQTNMSHIVASQVDQNITTVQTEDNLKYQLPNHKTNQKRIFSCNKHQRRKLKKEPGNQRERQPKTSHNQKPTKNLQDHTNYNKSKNLTTNHTTILNPNQNIKPGTENQIERQPKTSHNQKPTKNLHDHKNYNRSKNLTTNHTPILNHNQNIKPGTFQIHQNQNIVNSFSKKGRSYETHQNFPTKNWRVQSLEGPLTFFRLGTQCYIYGDFTLNWFKASEFCHSFGHDVSLAVIETMDENRRLRNWLKQNGNENSGVWIGGSDNGHKGLWAWFPTGNFVDYENWSLSQPSGGDQHCMYMVGGIVGYRWADFNCDFEMNFLCEFETDKSDLW